MLHKERVSSVHRYAKGADDSLSGYMFESIHMPALNSIENPFFAKVDSESFMDSKAEPSISPGAPAQSTWFGLVSMAVKKDLLTDLLAEHHSIPTGSMRMFKRVPLVDVHRAQMFDSVAEQILAAQPEELAAGINVQFENEIGMDSGGLTKEFFNLVCADLLPKGEEDQASSFDGYDGAAAAAASVVCGRYWRAHASAAS